jgi:ABC-type nitrate/sulfonate/bicarbonate transport system substrate-binding protein
MKRRIVCLLLLTSAMVAACSPQAPTVAPPAAAQRSGTLRVSVLGISNVIDVPSLMALDALEQQGYQTEVIHFAKGSLLIPALLQGDVELSAANSTRVGAALAEGADIRVFVGKTEINYLLVTKAGIQHCRDLDGKTITFSSRQSVGFVMFEEYIQEHCPGITPEIVLISGPENRVVALEAGEVDAAYLGLEDWLYLQEVAPGEFYLLIDFPKEFPEVQLSMFSARREWAEENRGMLEDFCRALLEVHRSIFRDPQLLADGIVKYLEFEPKRAQELAQEYLAAQMWDPNGQITEANIQATLDLLRAGDMLSADLTVEQFCDFSYLNAVLDEIGRQ